jgi:citrate lyase subunit beta/citryl-CoA lyase
MSTTSPGVQGPSQGADPGRRPGLARFTSVLFCPATRPDRVAKLPGTGTDIGVVDLEDAVAPAGKDAARADCRTAVAALALAAPDFAVAVRVNKRGSLWYERDIAMLAGLRVAAVVLPKVESSEDMADLGRHLAAAGQPDLPVMAGIETARGVTGIERIIAAGPPRALYFGAEDLAADLGGDRSEEGFEVLYARSHVALHARAAGVVPVDEVVVQLDDDARFERDAARGRSLGYQGKLCLHPRQVPLAKSAFRPSPSEVARSRRIVAAYDSVAAGGGGVLRLDGEMVDEPMVRRARQVLAAAEQEGQSTDGR